MTRSKRIYVLDTNVLMHDPTALFKFEEHDVYLPMQVIEELDNGKKGTSEASRNARQVSRFLNELVETSGLDNLAAGIPLIMSLDDGGRFLPQVVDFAGELWMDTNRLLIRLLAGEGRLLREASYEHSSP